MKSRTAGLRELRTPRDSWPGEWSPDSRRADGPTWACWRSRRSGGTKAASAGVFTTQCVRRGPRRAQPHGDATCSTWSPWSMNSGNANACTGAPGLAVARAMQKACAEALGVPAAQVAVASTGIIGVQLDCGVVTRRRERPPRRGVTPDGGPDFNRSIMTTDRFPKICAVVVETSAGGRPPGGVRQRRGDDLAGHGHHALRGDHRCRISTRRLAQTLAEGRGGAVVQPDHRRRGDEHQRHRVLPRQRRLGHARRRAPTCELVGEALARHAHCGSP